LIDLIEFSHKLISKIRTIGTYLYSHFLGIHFVHNLLNVMTKNPPSPERRWLCIITLN